MSLATMSKIENFKPLKDAWDGDPPNIYYISQEWPNSPAMKLSGGGTARMSPDDFEKELKGAIQSKGQHGLGSSRYQVNIWAEDPEDPVNHYVLVSWERFDSSACYDAVFVLYYEALHPRQVVERYMPELLDAYLSEHPEESLAAV